MKIGIIGTGISGLSASYWLSRSGYEVTLFEKQSRIGMGGLAVQLDEPLLKGGEIDVPSRLLNEKQWPSLFALYTDAGVETVVVDPAQTYISGQSSAYLKIDPASLFAANPVQLWSDGMASLYTGLSRLRKSAELDLQSGIKDSLTFGEYLQDGGYEATLQYGFLYPLLSSTVCTCSFSALDRYPARFVLGILSDLNQSGVRKSVPLLRTRFGTNDVVEKLTFGAPEILLGANVESVCESGEHVKVGFQRGSRLVERHFDHVIIATQANHAAKLVPSERSDLLAELKRFEYEDVRVVVHRDLRLLPAEKKQWSTFNFSVSGRPEAAKFSMCNIWLNRFYGWPNTESDWFQAINPFIEPLEECLVNSVELQRPIVSIDSFSAWNRMNKIQNEPGRRVWYSGSYAAEGVPLLESGVVSAANVVNKIKQSATAFVS